MVFCCQLWIVRHSEFSVPENTLRIFTLAELQKATKNFKSGFGDVHMGVVKSLTSPYNDITVAVKPVKRSQMGKRQFEFELRYLENIEHQNLVKLIGYCNEDSDNESNRFLVYEYSPKRSLDRRLSSLSWSTRLSIAKDAATGLEYLHELKIIFKDFKTSNILLDNEMNAKLSYFGRVREAPHVVGTSVAGTKGYSAPEYVQKGRLTTKMDVWSYGIFLQELITGGFPVAEENLENNPECMMWVCCYAGTGTSKLIVDPQLEGRYSEKSVQKVASIANKCLVLEPKRRPKMSAVLKLVKEATDLEISS